MDERPWSRIFFSFTHRGWPFLQGFFWMQIVWPKGTKARGCLARFPPHSPECIGRSSEIEFEVHHVAFFPTFFCFFLLFLFFYFPPCLIFFFALNYFFLLFSYFFSMGRGSFIRWL